MRCTCRRKQDRLGGKDGQEPAGAVAQHKSGRGDRDKNRERQRRELDPQGRAGRVQSHTAVVAPALIGEDGERGAGGGQQSPIQGAREHLPVRRGGEDPLWLRDQVSDGEGE